jgi:endoglucanase
VIRNWRISAVLIAILLAALGCTVPPTRSALPSSMQGLHVQGNQILNSARQVVQFRGVDRSGAEYGCVDGGPIFDGPTDTPAAIAAIKSWHVNAVRLPLNEDCWLGINGVPSQYSGTNYRNAIVHYVKDLSAAGIAAILNLHFSAPGTTVPHNQWPMADQDHAPAFWASVADTFLTNHSVIFDLFNEPNPNNNTDSASSWSCALNGGNCGGVGYTVAGMQEMVDDVRSTGATQPLMIAGPDYAGDLDRWLKYEPHDPLGQLIASIHIYGLPLDSDCRLESCWNSQMARVSLKVPVVIGEFGDTNCTDGESTPLMNWADRHGISYLAWAWNTGSCGREPSLIKNYSGTPTDYGVGVRNHLQSVG